MSMGTVKDLFEFFLVRKVFSAGQVMRIRDEWESIPFGLAAGILAEVPHADWAMLFRLYDQRAAIVAESVRPLTEEEALTAWLSALNDWRMTRGKPPQILADLARHEADQARTGKATKKRRANHEQK